MLVIYPFSVRIRISGGNSDESYESQAWTDREGAVIIVERLEGSSLYCSCAIAITFVPVPEYF